MSAGPPPPRPSTARLSTPPIAARRELSRPRVVTTSCWLWLVAALVAIATVALTVSRLDAVRADLGRAVLESDPSASRDTVDRVVDVSVLVIIIGGLVLGVTGGLVALGLRAGRGWARVTLTGVTVLVVGYGVLVQSATGWLVLGYAALTVLGAVGMYLPGSRRWFG
jgi:hypothetical protein